MNGISSTNAVLAVAIVLVVVGASAYLVLNEHSTTSTTHQLDTTTTSECDNVNGSIFVQIPCHYSSTTTDTRTGMSTSITYSNSTIGINLSVVINSTAINRSQGQDLQTVVEVLNIFPRINNVSVADDFPVRPLQSKCLPGDYTPIVVQVYQGIYDKGNISSAPPLSYYRSCPEISPNSIVSEYYYLFQPNSANATLYGRTEAGNFSNTGPMSLQLVNQVSIHQFSSPLPNGAFPAGIYTLMVEDWWGQIVILHFTMQS